MFPRASSSARPSILHRALRAAVAFATLEAVVPGSGGSGAAGGAAASGGARGRDLHPHALPLRSRRAARRPGPAAAQQPCVLMPCANGERPRRHCAGATPAPNVCAARYAA